jgi:hypothetical protein
MDAAEQLSALQAEHTTRRAWHALRMARIRAPLRGPLRTLRLRVLGVIHAMHRGAHAHGPTATQQPYGSESTRTLGTRNRWPTAMSSVGS